MAIKAFSYQGISLSKRFAGTVNVKRFIDWKSIQLAGGILSLLEVKAVQTICRD